MAKKTSMRDVSSTTKVSRKYNSTTDNENLTKWAPWLNKDRNNSQRPFDPRSKDEDNGINIIRNQTIQICKQPGKRDTQSYNH